MGNNKLTGYPSIDKPWLKYYSEEAINTPLPECTMYEYVFNCNQDNLKRIALNYYGKNISYGQLFRQISLIAGNPLSARDVKKLIPRKCRTYQHLRLFVKS